MRAEATADEIAPDESRAIVSPARLEVQGLGLSASGPGVGAVTAAALTVSGDGPSTWTVAAGTSGPVAGQRSIQAFGQAGGVPAYAAFIDEGGDDSYSMAGNTIATASGVSLPGGTVAIASAASTSTIGFGMGGLGNVGSFVDEGNGNDSYLAEARAVATATVTDAAGNGLAEASTSNAGVSAFGFGGDAVGTFEDQGGNDRYVVNVEARATASSTGAGTQEGRATGGYAFASAFASSGAGGHGLFIDRGGDDSYSSTAVAGAAATPATDVVAGGRSSSVLGSVSLSSAAFLDDGGNDTISIVPPDATMVGTRGDGTWLDAGGPGVGTNR